MTGIDPEVSQLGYWRDRQEKRAWTARVTIIVAIVGLLVLNTYLMFLSTDAVVLNIDQARLEQSDHVDRLERQLEQLQARVAGIEGGAQSEGGQAEFLAER